MIAGSRAVWVCARTEAQLRAAALAALLPSDRVLAIGCRPGGAAAAVHAHLLALRAAARADPSEEAEAAVGSALLVLSVSLAAGESEGARGAGGAASLRYAEASGLETAELLRIAQALPNGVSVLLVGADCLPSGRHGPLESLGLLRQLSAAFAPGLRLLVARSRSLEELADSAQPAAQLWREQGDAGDAWERLLRLRGPSRAASPAVDGSGDVRRMD